MAIAEIASVLSAVKTASETAKVLMSLKDSGEIQETAKKLNNEILAAQIAAFEARVAQEAIHEENRALKSEIEGLKRWENEKKQFQLVQLNQNVFAYKRSGTNDVAPKYCATCFEAGRKSILQQETRSPGRSTVLLCHSCGSDLYVTGHRPVPFERTTNRRWLTGGLEQMRIPAKKRIK